MDISQLLLQQPKDAMVEDNTLPFLAQDQRRDPDLKYLITLPNDPAETYTVNPNNNGASKVCFFFQNFC